ncbi:hypothetical protein EGW08_022502 [Elysia chlorotica]|uniref:SWIM-type domain-containing protein n=1 Tax=Elysia chlorotica TaxID=188477 RepID=A0A433SKT9_ELYCH|nr:hypothetical protein EGW08_022502 [Elysia chlorotica]
MLSATSMEELEQIYETFVITAKMKSKLIEHFSQIWNSRHGWAIPLTRIEQCGDCPTYNFFQKVFQGLPFQRQGLSFLQVFTYTAHVLSQQHRANILHMLSVYESKAKLPPDARGLSADPVLKDTRVSHMNGDLYEVCLDGQTYLLDDSVSFCTCKISKRCTCKHLLALRHYQACLWSTDDPLTCGDQRKLYLEIATGHTEWDVEKGNRQQVKSLEAGRMKRSGDSEAFCGDSEGDIDGDESDTESASSVTVHPENTNTSHRDVKCTSILKKLFAEKPHFLKPTIINKIKTKIFLNATEKAKRDLRSSESREGKTILDPVVKCVAESASQLHLALQCDEMESSHSAHIETETQTERNILSGATGQTSKNSTSHKTESVCKRTSIQATDQTSKNSITNTIGSISKNSTVLATSHTSKNSITNTTGSISKNSTVPATSHTSKNSIANATGSISKNSTILVTDHSSKNNAINTIGSISNNSTVLATSHTSKNSITNTTGSISKNSTIGTDHSSKNNTINTIGSICKNLTVLVTDRTSKNKTTYTIRPISKKPTDTTGSMVKNPKNTTEPISKNLINTTGCISQNPTNTTGCISKNLTNTAGSISKNPTNTTGCISKNPTNAAGSISKNLTNTTGSISKNPTLTALRDPVEEAIREFDAVSTRIKQALRENPSVLLKPFQTFVEEGKQRLNSAASLAGLFTKEDRTTTSSGMKLSPCSTPIVIYSSSCYREDCTKCNFRSRMKRSHTGDTLPVVPTKKKALDPQVSKNNNTCAE